MAGGDDVNGGPLGGLLKSLENRVVLMLAAGLLGVSGNQILQVVNPPAPDRFTGLQGEAHNKRIAVLERLQALDDAHRLRASEGWAMLYEMREDVALIKQRLQQMGN